MEGLYGPWTSKLRAMSILMIIRDIPLFSFLQPRNTLEWDIELIWQLIAFQSKPLLSLMLQMEPLLSQFTLEKTIILNMVQIRTQSSMMTINSQCSLLTLQKLISGFSWESHEPEETTRLATTDSETMILKHSLLTLKTIKITIKVFITITALPFSSWMMITLFSLLITTMEMNINGLGCLAWLLLGTCHILQTTMAVDHVRVVILIAMKE